MPRALNGSTSIRSIFPERAKSPSSSPRWSSVAARSLPNETSKRRGSSGRPSSTSRRGNCSRSRGGAPPSPRGPTAGGGVNLRLQLLRSDDPLEEPHRGAVAELLDLRHAEAGPRRELALDDGVDEAPL